MRKYDFTKPGGFPLTQDVLAYMQTGYTEMLNALASIGGAGPYVLSGMQPVGTTWTTSPGWVYFQGELFYFAGLPYPGSMPTPPFGSGLVNCYIITETDTPLTFNDGSTPAVQVMRTLTIGFGSPTLTAASFPIGTVLPSFVKEGGFTTISCGGGGYSGTVNYRKNTLANTLQLQGSFAVTGAAVQPTVSGSGPQYDAVALLPAGYTPASNTPFAAFYRYHLAPVTDDTGLDHILQINCEVQPSGYIAMGFIKAAANYTLYFNTIIPLD